MTRSNCSHESFAGICALAGIQSTLPLLIRSSPNFSPSLRTSKTTSACNTILVVGMLMSTSCRGISFTLRRAARDNLGGTPFPVRLPAARSRLSPYSGRKEKIVLESWRALTTGMKATAVAIDRRPTG